MIIRRRDLLWRKQVVFGRCAFLIENRGKSGSVRVCYTDFEEYEVIYLITAFEKKDQENLTDAEKNTLRKFVKALRDAEAERRKKK